MRNGIGVGGPRRLVAPGAATRDVLSAAALTVLLSRVTDPVGDAGARFGRMPMSVWRPRPREDAQLGAPWRRGYRRLGCGIAGRDSRRAAVAC